MMMTKGAETEHTLKTGKEANEHV